MSVFDSETPIIAKIDEVAASQKTRLFDIYALGPLLLYASTRKTVLGPWTKRALFISGIMTIAYNWKKYRSIETDLKKAVADVS